MPINEIALDSPLDEDSNPLASWTFLQAISVAQDQMTGVVGIMSPNDADITRRQQADSPFEYESSIESVRGVDLVHFFAADPIGCVFVHS